MEDGPERSEIVQRIAGMTQPEGWHVRNGSPSQSEARPLHTNAHSPSALHPNAEQPFWSPVSLLPTSTQRFVYPKSPPTVASEQLAEARPGPSPINHPAFSTRSSASHPCSNAQANRAAQYRQLPRLQTFVTQNTTSAGRDASPLMNELGRSAGRDHRALPSSVPASASRKRSRESPNCHMGVPAVPPLTLARQRSATTSHSPHSDPAFPLRPSNSIPDYNAAEAAPVWSRNQFPPARPNRSCREQDVQESECSGYPSDTSPRYDRYDQEQFRTSFRSGVTTGSSFMGNSSCTERDSDMTIGSSMGDAATLSPDWIEEYEYDGGMSVDEAIGMYERGFYDDDEEDEGQAVNGGYSMADDVRGLSDTPSDSQMQVGGGRQRSAAVVVDMTHAVPRDTHEDERPLPPPERSDMSLDRQSNDTSVPNPIRWPQAPLCPSRDRYGFKKETQHITVAQYDAWSTTYEQTLERRRRKWMALMKENGLSTQNPVSFPPRSAKVKRFVRKGIPPEWRGVAWFWYAGGSAQLAEHPRLYVDLVRQAEKGDINKNDREMIERDLNRTFPDNIRFKPDPTTTSHDTAGNAGGGGANGINHDPQQRHHPTMTTSDDQYDPAPETPKLQSLRRVLQAFSIHNPRIGYCQSLNFLAGLLLLFMSEERTFWMLKIITATYLPGTHSLNLEGANVDLAVLMNQIEESLPAIWAKINDCPETGRRLPSVSLCTTAWFMSCFIGNLPIETVLRVWDSFFYEGSKTLFRVALTLFKLGETELRAVNDPMEAFLVVQNIPRSLVDASALMDAAFFKRRTAFAHISQEKVDERRRKWRGILAGERAGGGGAGGAAEGGEGGVHSDGTGTGNGNGNGNGDDDDECKDSLRQIAGTRTQRN
ncbi:MAG: hypothetical protein M1816_004075 [Peltula sp. TS41687]|nr:MAG: hypothetical protein M1816_004075 [Peltula sp. TS41687]